MTVIIHYDSYCMLENVINAELIKIKKVYSERLRN